VYPEEGEYEEIVPISGDVQEIEPISENLTSRWHFSNADIVVIGAIDLSGIYYLYIRNRNKK